MALLTKTAGLAERARPWFEALAGDARMAAQQGWPEISHQFLWDALGLGRS